MKLKIILIFIICFSKTYSQKIEQRIGSIKITKEVYYLPDEKNKKIEKYEFYFDTDGKLLEKISYGTPHNEKLNFIGKIDQFSYSGNNLLSEKNWISNCNCKKGKFKLYTTDYIYNENDLLIKKVSSNPISSPFVYKYEENKKEIHNGDFYIQQIFDSEKRIIQVNQISENTNKIRWQQLYEYKNNCRISNFQSFYGDGKENFKSEIICYDLNKRILSTEIISYNKTKLYNKYTEEGLIEKIEEYESSIEKENYKLLRLTKIKVDKTTSYLTSEILEKINSELL